jgi:luciferase family oxidoreductase group 1
VEQSDRWEPKRSGGEHLRLSVLDQSPMPSGASATDAINNTIDLAKRTEALGYYRYWVAEHHASSALAGSVPEVLLARLGAETNRIRLGSGGVMLSHYAPYKVAEAFRMLEVMYPGRIDLGIGRAPGSDQLTAMALSKSGRIGADENFPNDVVDVVRWLHDEVEPTHKFAKVTAMPTGPTAPDVWLLGSSDYSALCAAHLGLPFSFAHFIAPDGGDRVMAA